MAAPTTIAVVNLKGGAGKTTTAAYTAHALHEQGRRVLVVDADPQRSAWTWSQVAPWPDVGCLAEPHDRLDRLLPGMSPAPDVVVIDTPGTEHGRGITLSAVRAATHVLIPTAPTGVEYARLADLRALLDQAVEQGAEFDQGVLLTRAVGGASSTRVYREQMTGDGWHVLGPVVPRREEYAQSYGEQIRDARLTGYAFAVVELLAGLAVTR